MAYNVCLKTETESIYSQTTSKLKLHENHTRTETEIYLREIWKMHKKGISNGLPVFAILVYQSSELRAVNSAILKVRPRARDMNATEPGSRWAVKLCDQL